MVNICGLVLPSTLTHAWKFVYLSLDVSNLLSMADVTLGSFASWGGVGGPNATYCLINGIDIEDKNPLDSFMSQS